MIPLSSIIKQFKDRFPNRYQKHIRPDHIRALNAMEQCKQEHGPQMPVRCTDRECGKEMYIPHIHAGTEAALTARTMKAGSG